MNPYRRIEAGRHRALETRLWPLLEELDGDAIRLLFYCWIGPHSTPFGILDVPEAYLLHDLGWKSPRLRRAWAVLEKGDLAWRDGNLIFIVPFLMANPPAHENVLTGWRKQISQLPESRFFKILHDRASIWLKLEGLSWLNDKIAAFAASQPCADAMSTSKLFENGSEKGSATVSKLSAQGAENREQYSGSREQGVQGEEPNGALRALRRVDGSLRAPVLMNTPAQRKARLTEFLGGSDGDIEARLMLCRQSGYAEGEIEEALVSLRGRSRGG